jgi:hypothetical protein
MNAEPSNFFVGFGFSAQEAAGSVRGLGGYVDGFVVCFEGLSVWAGDAWTFGGWGDEAVGMTRISSALRKGLSRSPLWWFGTGCWTAVLGLVLGFVFFMGAFGEHPVTKPDGSQGMDSALPSYILAPLDWGFMLCGFTALFSFCMSLILGLVSSLGR